MCVVHVLVYMYVACMYIYSICVYLCVLCAYLYICVGCVFVNVYLYMYMLCMCVLYMYLWMCVFADMCVQVFAYMEASGFYPDSRGRIPGHER